MWDSACHTIHAQRMYHLEVRLDGNQKRCFEKLS